MFRATLPSHARMLPAGLPEREKCAGSKLVLVLRRKQAAAPVVNDRDDVGAEPRDHRRERLLVSTPQAGKQLLFVHTGSSMFRIVS